MRNHLIPTCAAALLLAVIPTAHAQDPATDLQQKLAAQLPLTKFTADKTDIVTAGSVLVLQKDGLLLYTVSVSVPPINTIKNGKFNQGFGDTMKVDMLNGKSHSDIAKKTLVTGQKIWLSSISVEKDKVFFDVLTDPYDDGRYFARIKVEFPKNSMPSSDDLLKQVAQFMTLDASTPAPAAAAAAPPPPPEPTPAMAPIPPPPPPPDQPAAPPPTISLGEKKDDVVAAMGQPTRIVKLGNKEILYFTDMKITLVGGKVSDVQ